MELAYDYGEYTSEGDHAVERGIYLCVWRLESDGAWKIALDLQKSAPAEKMTRWVCGCRTQKLAAAAPVL
jgi:hypothetical protein